jgi:predicted MFS family arabinose efflux permease
MNKTSAPKIAAFTAYEIFVIATLTILQFTIVLDFMVLSPLGAQLMKELAITPAQFSVVVMAYAISAGLSGLLAAGFADKYDRKKLLLFFYTGFILGTFFCGVAPDYNFLLAARIVTGIFGGVIGSISFAIITDLFKLEVRGRVMGFVQMAFASSQVLGIPVGLYLANHLGWHAPFLMIVILSIILGVFIVLYLKPIDAHLKIQSESTAFQHFMQIISQSRYQKAFAATTLLATGGFMLMPFASAFSVNNLGISLKQLPMVYMITGIFSMAAGPLIGKFSDRVGKYKIFIVGTIVSMILVVIYCNLSVTPIWVVIVINTLMFFGIMARIISSSALMTAVPDAKDRGAFMGINSSVQQISGGIAAGIAGLIVVQKTNESLLENYDIVGYVVVGTSIITVILLYFINQHVMRKQAMQRQ